jgi:hypothetical protein
MTDTDEPTGGDEPTRVDRRTDTDLPGSAASTTPGRRVDGSVDPPDQPVWARKPVIIGAVAAVVVVALLAFFLLKDDGDTETAVEDDRDTTSQSTTTDPLDPTTGSTAPPVTDATPTTPPPATDPEATVGTPTTALGNTICQAFNRLEEGIEPVYNPGEVSDAELVSRAEELGHSIDVSVALFQSLDDKPYAADAEAYATFLAPFAGKFREASTVDQIDALGDELLEPEIDVAEAATRLQDEWDAECG